jgi:hypothetical protein
MLYMQTFPISLSATAPHGVTLPRDWFTSTAQHRVFQESVLETLRNPPEWFSRRELSLCEKPTILPRLPEEFRECITVSVPPNSFKTDCIVDYGSDPLAHDSVGRFQRTGLPLYIPAESCHAPGRLLIPSPIQVNHYLPSWSISAIGSYGESSLKEMLLHLVQGKRPVALFYPGASNNLVATHQTRDVDPICAYFHDLTHLSLFRGFRRDDVQRIAARLYAHYVKITVAEDPYLIPFEKLVLKFCDGFATDSLRVAALSDRTWQLRLASEIEHNMA